MNNVQNKVKGMAINEEASEPPMFDYRHAVFTETVMSETKNTLQILLDEVANKKTMGGGLRYNEGKAELHQVPSSLTFAVAKVLQFGQQKYSKANWRKGMSYMTVYDCLQRHLMKWNDKEEVDSESLLPHLYHAAANIAFLIEYMETYPEGDDRYSGKINTSQDSFDKVKFAEYKKPENK